MARQKRRHGREVFGEMAGQGGEQILCARLMACISRQCGKAREKSQNRGIG